MIEPRDVKKIIDNVLAASPAETTEVLVFGQNEQLTRFANSIIHQNVAQENLEVRVRAIVGRRQGVASTNRTSPEALARAAESALAAARLQPERDEPILLAGPASYADAPAFDSGTAECAPAYRAEAVRQVCAGADAQGLTASGAFSTGAGCIAIGNSQGLYAFHASTHASFNSVIMGEDSSGFAESAAWKVGSLDTAALGQEAIDTALRSQHPRSMEAGEYPVVLKPYAVADLLSILGYIGFGALALQEQRSFMTGQIGQQVASPLVTVYDDALNPLGMPMPFDFQGVPRQSVSLIDKGIARGVVYDLETAAREGRASTGHGLPAPNPWGPMPMHLFMEPGTAELSELIAGIERGLLVTRFHYTVPVHERQTVVTGMTRDGTFWIENGQIAYPVKNLRFTQSYIEALNNVEQLGRDVRLLQQESGSVRAPAAHLRGFRFTGVTQF